MGNTVITNEPLFSEKTVFLIFLFFLISIILFLILKKIYYRFKLRKRYYIIPRIGVKGITNVAMTIALSVAIILLLTVMTSGILGIVFRAYPGWRVTIEQFLIQLGGLIFGPIIGLMIGGLTDLLTIALTSGVFHYGYFIICLTYGLLSGLLGSIFSFQKFKTMKFICFSSTLIVILEVLFITFVALQHYSTFDITIFSMTFSLTKMSIILIFSVVACLVLISILIISLSFNRQSTKLFFLKSKYNVLYNTHIKLNDFFTLKNINSSLQVKHFVRWYAKRMNKIISLKNQINSLTFGLINENTTTKWFNKLVLVILTCFLCQSICNTFLLPFYDVSFSSFGYDFWFALRVLVFPILMIIDLLILYPCYYAVSSLIKYNYHEDLVEDLKRPYMESY